MTNIIKTGIRQLKENRLFIVLSLLVLLVGQYAIEYQPSFWPKIYILLAVAVILMLGLILSPSRTDKLAKNTFVLIFLIGSLNSLILPIRQNLDENTHYSHALQEADGKIRSQTDERNFLMVSPDFLAITKLPSKPEYDSLYNTNLYTEEFMQLLNIKSDYKLEYINKGGINNPAFIPSAIGIKLGQLISPKLYVSYYLGRIFNVLFYALLAFWAVKISKFYQLQLFAMSLLPFVTWIVSGYNYDSLYYGLVLLVMSQFTNFVGEDHSFTVKKGVFYGLSCLGLIFCKAPVILMIFLPFFLPKRVFATAKTYWLNFLTLAGVGLVALLWVSQASIFKLLNLTDSVGAQVTEEVGTSISRLDYFIGHPIYTVEVIIRSLFDIPSAILDTFLKPQPFMPVVPVISAMNIISFVAVMILISLQLTISVSKAVKRGFWIIFFVISLAIMYAISGDSRVFEIGDLHIGGVQGRYHYYLLVFLPLLLSPIIKKTFLLEKNAVLSAVDNQKIMTDVFYIVAFVAVVNTCVSLYAYF